MKDEVNLIKIHLFIKYDTSSRNPFFLENNLKQKSPSANAKGLEISKLPQQNDFRTFCMSEETEKVYRKLEEAICLQLILTNIV